MPRINVLPKNIADLIAAGEVVERPSSVIKEFVENSIDAGSTNITVEIKNGGKTYIRVTDNGFGIERDDVKKAFISHATSKISTADDLNSISTLGFRGEALASICAVSRVEIMTATKDAESGTRYAIEGGEETFFDDVGCPRGTTLIVRDLFFNIPARMKFLKKDIQEGNYIASLLERIAVSNPNIAFKFIRDGKLQFSTPGDGDLKSAVYAVFGREFTEQLLPVNNEQNGISVSGFVTKPSAGRGNRTMQIFFVNKRYVKSVVFLSALEAAYKNSIMVGKYPACVLFVDLPFEAVDVNVHPAKTEVRFFDEKRIFDAIYNGVLASLQADKSRVQATFSPAKYFTQPPEKGEQLKLTETKPEKSFVIKEFGKPVTGVETKVHSSENTEPKQLDFLKDEYLKPETNKLSSNFNYKMVDEKSVEPIKEPEKPFSEFKNEIIAKYDDAHSFTQNVSIGKAVAAFEQKNDDLIKETPIQEEYEDNASAVEKTLEETRADSDKVIDFKYIGQAFSTYLIAEVENKLLLIDKHAAHERILFEKFKNDGIGESQMMLIPVTVTLSSDEYNAVLENLDLLSEAGYDITDFGNRCVKISACPPELTDCDITEVITEIADYLSRNIRTVLPEKLDWIYHSMACRAAVKAGNFTSDYEARLFIKELLSRDDIRYCPHGRPVMVEMTQRELEKQFKRIV